MRIPSGKTDIAIYFVAVDATDYVTRETGLASFTVQRSRNGAAEVAYTTPTITEIDATNMPGVYSLLIDEDTTIASTSDSEEYCIHITHAGMAPITRTIELYRRDTTSGQTITVANGAADADIERLQGSVIATPTVAGVLEVDVTHWIGTAAATPTVAGVPEVDITHFGGSAGTFASGRPEVNASHISGSSTAADNAEVVFATDFATNYDTTLDRWQVDVDTWLGTTAQGAAGRPQVDLELWLGSAPNALVSGRVDTSTGAMAANVLTATAINADAFTAAKFAADVGAEFADAVWDEDATAHQTTGTFGQAIGDPVADTNTIYGAVVTGAAGATVAADIIAVKAETAAIVADTNELQTDWANGGRLDVILDARASQTSVDTIDGIVDAILIDTAEIGAAGAGLTAINLPDQTMNITGNITGNLSGSVGSVTGLTASNLDATISSRASQTSVDDLPTNAELATALGTADDATLAAISALSIPTANQNADALLDRANGIETGLTLRNSLRLVAAVLAGKVSGAGTGSETFRNAVDDTKNRVVSTVDVDGNRTAVTTDLS